MWDAVTYSIICLRVLRPRHPDATTTAGARELRCEICDAPIWAPPPNWIPPAPHPVPSPGQRIRYLCHPCGEVTCLSRPS